MVCRILRKFGFLFFLFLFFDLSYLIFVSFITERFWYTLAMLTYKLRNNRTVLPKGSRNDVEKLGQVYQFLSVLKNIISHCLILSGYDVLLRCSPTNYATFEQSSRRGLESMLETGASLSVLDSIFKWVGIKQPIYSLIYFCNVLFFFKVYQGVICPW